jgi:hypothetical protein
MLVTAISAAEAQSIVLYAATLPFVTRATDTPADTPFLGTLAGDLVVSRSLSDSDGYSGYVQNISEFTLINAGGDYDFLGDDYSVNGQRIVTRIGAARAFNDVDAYAQFEMVTDQLGERFIPTRNALRIEHSDATLKLQVPAQPSAYSGLGDLEGGAELAGKRRPIGLSNVFNATPVLVVASEGLYQCHDGSNATITVVKDGGIPLNFVANYATLPLLRAAITNPATVPPGSFATCNAAGYFGIGGIATKQITVDFTLSTHKTADIIQWLILNSTTLTTSDFDNFTFTDLNNKQPAVRQYFLGPESTKTVADVMTDLMKGIGGWWGVTTLGKVRLARMEAPSLVASAYYDLNGGTLTQLDRVPLPVSVDPPPRRRRVTYAHNETPQSDIYPYISENDPALAAYLAMPYKVAATSDDDAAAILADYPFAPDPEPGIGYFRDEADAQAEADRLLTLYASGHRAFRFTVKNALFAHQVGEVVNIADTTIAPRLDVGASRYVRVVEVNDRISDMSTEMVGFG